MTAIECRESLAVLLRRRTDKGVAKLEGMATAIAPKALAGELARGGVDGHGVEPGKKSRDSFLLAAPHPSADLGAANRRVAQGFRQPMPVRPSSDWFADSRGESR